MEAFTGDAYCVKCKDKIAMENGRIRVSDSGRRMAQGTCAVCGTKVNRILGREYPNMPIFQPQPTNEESSGKTAVQVIAAQIGDPNLYQIEQMAERVLKVLLEIDPEIENKLELWDDKRVEKKLYKKWRKKVGADIANEINKINLDEEVRNTPLLLEAIVNIKRKAISIAKGEQGSD